ncbi:probable LRR receptor-like serine/threonine-protein kinase At4g36180 [Aristolochia californica]|uniref:probable LRR receptor-like serine/threonine-protein kinase At4g36180 n=1 Tax=Aristolochia californica TaxID=171875 RepID=UPI0035D93163
MGCWFLSQKKFLIVLLAVMELLQVVSGSTNSGDIEALKEFMRGFESSSVTPGSCLSSWDFAYDPCDASFSDHFTCGFRCDATVAGYSRVTEISLDRAGYTGYLSFLSLPYLETLDVADNRLAGAIPISIGNLTSLRRLTLSNNFFSGEIPSSIAALPALEELYLDNNLLQGEIPADLGQLQSLKRLELQGNGLSGEFLDLGSLQNLLFLDASNNLLSGALPTNLPSSLVVLSMRNNSFEGGIPSNLRRLTFLQVVDLSHNKLSGAIAPFLFEHPSLEQLTLSYNSFISLEVPASYGLKSQLIAIDIGYNKLQGLLPAFVAVMPRLSALSLGNNQFTGMIPSQYALKTVLPGPGTAPFMRLLLSGNYLFGPIPSPLMGMKSGSATVSLVDNCLLRCPQEFFFCQGGQQKSSSACRRFSPVIPLQ